MTWTDERVETLKKLWADGLSASQIAAELGGITRNAVIGKVHRLGLAGRAKSPSSAASRPRKPRAHSHMLRVGRSSIRGNTALVHAYDFDIEPEPEFVDNVIPLGQRRTLADRRSRAARLLLLRRADHHRPSLLRLSFARGLSASPHAPRPPAIQRLIVSKPSWPGLARPSTSFVTGKARRGCPAQGRA